MSPPRKAAKKPKAAPVRTGYHHGDLRQSLIDATEALLAERGAEGFSLREVARRSGVSPAAPAHHFGDAQGLLTAVATLAFDQLTAALREGEAQAGANPLDRLRGQGLGYVRFALAYPGRFGLMFRCDMPADDALHASAQAAFRMLEDGVRALTGVAPGQPLAPAQWQALVATWSLVHGFAHLMLAGQFEELAASAGGREALVDALLQPLLQRQLAGLRAPMGPETEKRRRSPQA